MNTDAFTLARTTKAVQTDTRHIHSRERERERAKRQGANEWEYPLHLLETGSFKITLNFNNTAH